MPSNYYKAGSWNVRCDVCGFRHKSDNIKKRWDGLLVCPEDWEMDHPQKYLRVRETGQAVPYIREDPDLFLAACYLWGASAYADLAEADCARADMAIFTYAFLLALKDEAGLTDFSTLYLYENQLYLNSSELGL